MKTTTTIGLGLVWLLSAGGCGGAEANKDVNSVGMRMVPIAAGEFNMGQPNPPALYDFLEYPEKFDDADWDEKPERRVKITRPFAMSATEVTLGQFRKFRPDHAAGRGDDDEAVRGVSWHDAVAFCEWLSKQEGKTYRLPTEAEWEFACRAGTTTLFHTGNALPNKFITWYGEKGFRERYFPTTMPLEYQVGEGTAKLTVGRTPANAWGLHDMHGNVAEWCADWYGPYETDDATDPVGRASGDFRVIRGGSHTTFTRLLRSANRAAWLPDSKNEKTGFRVVLGDAPPTPPLPPPAAPLHAQNVSQSAPDFSASAPADRPYFLGPQVYVKIPFDSYGPMFSAHNHSPAITECPNGDLLVVWYSCVNEPGSELCNLASRMRQGTAEWDEASPFWDGIDVNDHAPKLWWDGDKTLFHWARGNTENIVRTSTDNGATWSPAKIMQPFGELGNQPVRLRDGRVVMTLDSQSTSLVVGADGGTNGDTEWSFLAVPDRNIDYRDGGQGTRHAGIHAPVVELADGRLMTIGRLNEPAQQAKFDGTTPISYSSDGGRTWTYAKSPFPAISSVQRAVLMRLEEGPLLLCSFTDQRRDWNARKGMTFPTADGGEMTGYGLFAALSYDDGATWPARRLITAGGDEKELPSIDHSDFKQSRTMAESGGYLAACQTRDGLIQLISSKNHYAFNLAWIEAKPE